MRGADSVRSRRQENSTKKQIVSFINIEPKILPGQADLGLIIHRARLGPNKK